MSKYTFTYFPFGGPRASPIRQAFKLANIEFEDKHVTGADWVALRDSNTLPFNSIPVLEVDGKTLSQSNAIMMFIGSKAGLVPEDAFQRAKAEEVLCAVEDFISAYIMTSVRESDKEKVKVMREAMADKHIPFLCERLSRLIEQNGDSGFFVGDSLTVADLKAAALFEMLSSGRFDHISKDCITPFPLCVGIMEKVRAKVD
eukprot:m.480421 g.480421  ORF g.480421 m.480421 type:complete len:201 (+) comp21833_c0_seq1:140-742(+)